MNYRQLLGLLVSALLAATLLGTAPTATASYSSTSVSPAPAASVNPKQDFPRLPRYCATRKDLIPPKPVTCKLNDFRKNRPTLVLWGDSHAWHLIPGLKVAVRSRDINLVAFMMGSCPVMDNNLTDKERRTAYDCLKSNERALNFIGDLKRGGRDFRVLVSSNWQRYRHLIKIGDRGSYAGQMAHFWKEDGARAFKTLGRMKVGVDVVGQAVTVPENHKNCKIDNDPFACNLSRRQALPDERGTKRWVKHQMNALAGSPRYIDINRMCNAKVCLGRPDGVYTFWDDLHISASMSKLVAPVFAETVTRAGGSEPDGDGGGGCQLIIFCR
jgi:hypothetical protein